LMARSQCLLRTRHGQDDHYSRSWTHRRPHAADRVS
jgi:hypothetical protein